MPVDCTEDGDREHVAHLELDFGELNLLSPEAIAELRGAAKLVPDDVVQLITASGTADECRAKVREYVDAGCTCPILYPLGDDVKAMIDAFADGYGT
jgi:alkanesulfonate monooxygenase SsuD/methylene tetrahydromethanopterin reductase-like flavin-dependent oxidoreductase (luciferase family)